MTHAENARMLFEEHDRCFVQEVTALNCRHSIMRGALHAVLGDPPGPVQERQLGMSLEGRPITMLSFGRGPTPVLLWSQMHGDESTATLALLDMTRVLVTPGAIEQWVRSVADALTLHWIPMLNPDGAERRRRYTAVHIDVNRDALELASPEARVLRDAHRLLNPTFGFNLHDQEVRSAGNSPQVTALALLAPPADVEGTVSLSRLGAMQLASVIVEGLHQFIPGHMATYDDAYEPRAFGDSMQSWGTSTLLVESGQWPGDPDKIFIRKLTFVALLTAIGALASGSYKDVDVGKYAGLKKNGKRMFDIIIRGIQLWHHSGWEHPVDLGMMRVKGKVLAETAVLIEEVGDLSTHGALETWHAHGVRLGADDIVMDAEVPLREILCITGISGAA
jgi:hypothetical protein